MHFHSISASISIHPMLRFILLPLNNSSQKYLISIHPMLRFIIRKQRFLPFKSVISIHPMLRFINPIRSKKSAEFKFQYIPCYGLSTFEIEIETTQRRFQYIPCYGLSETPDYKFQELQNFNTSHVTVYRLHPLHQSSCLHDFNTSHVTVYRNLSRKN